MRLVVTNAVIRGHHGVAIAFFLPGKHAHLGFDLEGLVYFIIRASGRLHTAIAVAPAASLLHNLRDHILGGCIVERAVAFVAQIPPEGFLQVFAQMLRHSFFRILLHLVIDGGINAESVLVQVVTASVRLEMLVEPAVQFIVRPLQGIHPVIFILGVRLALGLFGVHNAAKHIAEIGALAGIVVLHLIMQGDGQGGNGIVLDFAQIAVFVHLGEYEIASLAGPFGMKLGVVTGGGIDRADQHRALLGRQFGREFVEESAGGGPDAVGAAAEEHRVEIHRDDFVLGVIAFQFDGREPLAQFNPHHFGLVYAGDAAARFRAGIQSLGQLLGDGTATALFARTAQDSLENHTAQAAEIHARVFIETAVFRRYQRVDQVRGELVVSHIRTVLDVKGCQNLPVIGQNLRREFVLGIFQFFKRGNLRKESDGQQEEQGEGQGCAHHNPRPFYDFFSGFLFHFFTKFLQK